MYFTFFIYFVIDKYTLLYLNLHFEVDKCISLYLIDRLDCLRFHIHHYHNNLIKTVIYSLMVTTIEMKKKIFLMPMFYKLLVLYLKHFKNV